MTTDKQFLAECFKSASLAARHLEQNKKLSSLFEERYGINYSDANCDSLVECFDYTGSCPSLKGIDAEMLLCGYPVLEDEDEAIIE